jgi:hypothetical protein
MKITKKSITKIANAELKKRLPALVVKNLVVDVADISSPDCWLKV